MLYSKKILGLFLLLASLSLSSQSKNTTLDSLLRVYEKNNLFMGTVTVAKGKEIIFNNSYGYSDVAAHRKAALDTPHRIGDVTALFTTVMIYQLIDEGWLNLSTKLSIYFPEIDNASIITIEDLLSNKTGILDYRRDDKSYKDYAYKKVQSKSNMLGRIEAYKAIGNPNNKFNYSSTNHLLLGFILEEVTNMSYDQNLNIRILSKLDLKNTYLANTNKKGVYNSYVYEYDKWKNVEDKTKADLNYSDGSYGMVSTTTDLVHFMTSLFARELTSYRSFNDIIAEKEIQGRGIFKRMHKERYFYFLTGEREAFFTDIEHYPEDSLTIAVQINGLNERPADIINNIREIYFEEEINPIKTRPIDVPLEIMQQQEGVYYSEQLKLASFVEIKNKGLCIFPENQQKMELIAVANNEYIYKPNGSRIFFSRSGFYLQQGGKVFEFKKENKH